MNKRHLIFFHLILGLLLASCSYKQDQILFEQRAAADSLVIKNQANIANYRIQPQDILQIRNIQTDKTLVDLTAASTAGTGVGATLMAQPTNYAVEDDGTIALTGIGRVKISGLTRGEATAYLEKLYSKDYLKNPIFEVKIMNLKVTVLGEIKSPGNYQLVKDRTTLIQLLGEAGGLTDRANEKNIKIIRGDVNSPVVAAIDLSDIKSLADPRTILENGDIIYVSQNKKAVRADKINTFSTVIQPALIIFNTALIIFTLARR